MIPADAAGLSVADLAGAAPLALGLALLCALERPSRAALTAAPTALVLLALASALRDAGIGAETGPAEGIRLAGALSGAALAVCAMSTALVRIAPSPGALGWCLWAAMEIAGRAQLGRYPSLADYAEQGLGLALAGAWAAALAVRTVWRILRRAPAGAGGRRRAGRTRQAPDRPR
ncbi:MAG: hypothetical protein VYD87_17720 [Pseudomonadota bacterium]|nr:hypothetical protein [Pseudomonadota bacterium]MEE3098254.1 hypothetical protein [Pseudomonadota bacterium]